MKRFRLMFYVGMVILHAALLIAYCIGLSETTLVFLILLINIPGAAIAWRIESAKVSD